MSTSRIERPFRIFVTAAGPLSFAIARSAAVLSLSTIMRRTMSRTGSFIPGFQSRSIEPTGARIRAGSRGLVEIQMPRLHLVEHGHRDGELEDARHGKPAASIHLPRAARFHVAHHDAESAARFERELREPGVERAGGRARDTGGPGRGRCD
jgi:hypothetical protein